jgi:hypothetical protein
VNLHDGTILKPSRELTDTQIETAPATARLRFISAIGGAAQTLNDSNTHLSPVSRCPLVPFLLRFRCLAA